MTQNHKNIQHITKTRLKSKSRYKNYFYDIEVKNIMLLFEDIPYKNKDLFEQFLINLVDI